MVSIEFQAAADQLDGRTAFRAETIQAWVSLALKEPDPAEWTNALTSKALDRLATVQASLPVKAEARLQILDIRRAIQAGIARHRRRASAGGPSLRFAAK